MTILTKIEAEGRAALTAIEHAAAWLVGAVATGRHDLSTLEKDSPIVADAIAAGEAAAAAHGVPVAAIDDAGAAVLNAAKDLAAGLSSTAQPAAKA